MEPVRPLAVPQFRSRWSYCCRSRAGRHNFPGLAPPEPPAVFRCDDQEPMTTVLRSPGPTTGVAADGSRGVPRAWSAVEMAFWDARKWLPRAWFRRGREWVGASALRRRVFWCAVLVGAFVVFPGVLGAVAWAQSASAATSGSGGGAGIDALSWMDVRDSAGTRLTDYVFATDHGSLFSPLKTVVAAVLGLEFVGYMVIVTTAVWLIGFALGFRWLDPFGRALSGVGEALTGQIATPLLLVTAAGIGAFFVAWFVLRGFYSKATIQVVTMLAVAVIGPLFLAHPLAEVLSSDGLLAQGRNVGVAVAAGLGGDSNPDPDRLMAGMQGNLADNFARRPVQVWNFGHVIDQSPRCAAAWSGSVTAGDTSRVIDGLRACGDMAAYRKASNPSMGQIGSGLVLLVCAAIMLCFGAYLAVKIVWAALDAVYHGFMAVFGFTAGGFVYGPTQTFLARNLVDGLVSGARMTAYTIFLAVYALFLGKLFEQAGGQVTVVLVLGAIVEVVAILQLKRLAAGLDKGNEWIANRFALAMQGPNGKGGGGGGGATALGMGSSAGTGHALSPGLLATLAAVNTVNNNPIAGVLFGFRRNPFDPNSRLRNRAEVGMWRANAAVHENGWMLNQYRTRGQLMEAARSAVREHGNQHTPRSAAAAVDRVLNRGGSLSDVGAAMIDAGFTDEAMVTDAIRAYNYRENFAPSVWDGDKYIGEAAASLAVLKLGTSPANMALFQQTAHRLANRRYIDHVHENELTREELDYLHDYFAAPTRDKIRGIQALAGGSRITRDASGNVVQSNPDYPLPVEFEGWSQERGQLMNRFIMPHLAQQYLTAAHAGNLPRASEVLQVMANSEYWTGNVKLTPSKAIPRF
ncbi:hypothetical protein [Nocardia blacklockiae]|uniref:hypothetical protein n=1 Tax=Nocardia blacklockiae TaxID=480036 RepID=UPI001893E480|nr:hypothetical protein [Nocardia blacklockiae]MBF6170972.1 hypothetical protein [Nocardia blacklockiae]